MASDPRTRATARAPAQGGFLARLTDQPSLSDDEKGTSATKVDAALSARVDLMRGAESSLYDRRTKDLAQLRDDDVTALEIRVALLGALMLLAVGVATGMARSLTRPLAVLRIGSARVAGDSGYTHHRRGLVGAEHRWPSECRHEPHDGALSHRRRGRTNPPLPPRRPTATAVRTEGHLP